jgi:hypothetical protein
MVAELAALSYFEKIIETGFLISAQSANLLIGAYFQVL